MIGQRQFGGRADDLADAEAEHHLGHLLVGVGDRGVLRQRLRHGVPLDGAERVRLVDRTNG
jgi:hypothetical protein